MTCWPRGTARRARRAHALATYVYLGILQGRPTGESLDILDNCAALAERHGDVHAASWTAHHRAMLATWRGEFAAAAELFEGARRAFRAAGLLDAEAECAVKPAIVHAYGGDAGTAARLCHEVPGVTETHGETWLRGLALFAESQLARRSRAPREAAEPDRPAIRLLRSFHDWWDIAMCVEVIAWSSAGEPRRAARLLGVLHLLWGAVGVSLSTAPRPPWTGHWSMSWTRHRPRPGNTPPRRSPGGGGRWRASSRRGSPTSRQPHSS
ncbi:hypothetical protein [Streptomyces sp. NPDC093018]|uniref:hypothetical protein n=1 Tax=Streptomyces sp. NPDC093018 TaxID=3155067 RepID=UPI00342969A3